MTLDQRRHQDKRDLSNIIVSNLILEVMTTPDLDTEIEVGEGSYGKNIG